MPKKEKNELILVEVNNLEDPGLDWVVQINGQKWTGKDGEKVKLPLYVIEFINTQTIQEYQAPRLRKDGSRYIETVRKPTIRATPVVDINMLRRMQATDKVVKEGKFELAEA